MTARRLLSALVLEMFLRAGAMLEGGTAGTWMWSKVLRNRCACMTSVTLVLQARIVVERQHI
jgi:hypothetical protein